MAIQVGLIVVSELRASVGGVRRRSCQSAPAIFQLALPKLGGRRLMLEEQVDRDILEMMIGLSRDEKRTMKGLKWMELCPCEACARSDFSPNCNGESHFRCRIGCLCASVVAARCRCLHV